MPSPRGQHWASYILHRCEMMVEGIGAYAKRKYARLSFDKYIESNRERDFLAMMITKNKPSLVLIGAAEMPANSPIGIKKNKRCPGTRHLMNSIKKLHHSDVVLVNEDYTSQTCANCFKKFPRHTKSNRFKVCQGCTRDADAHTALPSLIVTKKSRRRQQIDRVVKRLIARGVMNPANQPAEFQRGRLKSQKMYFLKKWHSNPANGVQMEDDAAAIDQSEQPQQQQQGNRPFSIVWHRDIVAAKCIMYKGKQCSLMKMNNIIYILIYFALFSIILMPIFCYRHLFHIQFATARIDCETTTTTKKTNTQTTSSATRKTSARQTQRKRCSKSY